MSTVAERTRNIVYLAKGDVNLDVPHHVQVWPYLRALVLTRMILAYLSAWQLSLFHMHNR